MASGGWYLVEKNFVKEPGKSNDYYCLQVSFKFYQTTFKANFETLSALVVRHVTIVEEVVNKKFTICEVF